MKSYARLLSLFLSFLLLIGGCGEKSPAVNQQQGSEGQTVQDDRPIRISVSGMPVCDPAVGNFMSSNIALANLYDRLVRPIDGGTIIPWLADKWETSEDGRTFTFYLKKGVQFHDGTELKASDVVYSMNRVIDIGEGFAYLYADNIKECVAIDEYTVAFQLNEPFGPFVSTLCRFYVVNEKLVRENYAESGPYGEHKDYGKDWLLNHDAGSGAYVLTELIQQDHLKAIQFTNHFSGPWDPLAPTSMVIVDNTEAATVRTMLANQELEITDPWQSAENLDAMSKIPGVEKIALATGLVQYNMYNTKKAPTDDVYVRKALNYMNDYENISKSVFQGSPVSKSPVHQGFPGACVTDVQYTYDLEKAKEMLAQSKYAGELDKYPITLSIISDVADLEKLALAMQAEAKKVGLTIEIHKVPWVNMVDEVTALETTANITTINVPPHYPDVGSFLESRYTSKTAGTWEQTEWLLDESLDKEIQEALMTIDNEARYVQYKAIQNRIADELCPSSWLVDLDDTLCYHSDYVEWPSAERYKAGEPTTNLTGAQYFFKEFKIHK